MKGRVTVLGFLVGYKLGTTRTGRGIGLGLTIFLVLLAFWPLGVLPVAFGASGTVAWVAEVLWLALLVPFIVLRARSIARARHARRDDRPGTDRSGQAPQTGLNSGM